MAWSVDDIFSFSKHLINKAQRGEYTPAAFYLFWNAEQRSFQQDLLGRFQEAKQNHGAGVIVNTPVLKSLTPFIKKVTVVPASGVVAYPSDFKSELALRANGYRVIHFNPNQRTAITDSVIDPPSVADNKYYYTEYNNGFEVLPAATPSVIIDYIADCRDVVWGYINDAATDLPTYSAGTSTQPQWNNGDVAEITKRTLKLLGVHFSDRDFTNFGQSVQNAGK
jgi:hypothetical protein